MIIASFAAFFYMVLFLVSAVGTLVLLYLTLWQPDFTSLFVEHKIKLTIFIVLIVMLDLFSLYLIYDMRISYIEALHTVEVKKSREEFTLVEARQYGDLLLPKGTRIERYDPYDMGEGDREFRLTGLRYAEFPYPVKIASVWVSAIEIRGLLLLAQDQEISGVACKAGQMAWFHVPRIEYDIINEFGEENPDGANARLKTSEWTFWHCTDS